MNSILEKIQSFLNDFVMVEGGEYIMGDAVLSYAIPHKVSVDSFYIQVSTVTQEFWEVVMGGNPSLDKTHKDNPVTNVSWYDCQEFIKKLNALTDKKYRLPTEAEWEYAARGGKKSQGFKFAGSDNVDEVAWHGDVFEQADTGIYNLIKYGNSNRKIHPVKEKKPNELGLYDMSGNVWEWCQDWYSDYRLNEAYSKNPVGPDGGASKVYRGGCWNGEVECCHVAFRSAWYPENSYFNLGFRLLSQVE